MERPEIKKKIQFLKHIVCNSVVQKLTNCIEDGANQSTQEFARSRLNQLIGKSKVYSSISGQIKTFMHFD